MRQAGWHAPFLALPASQLELAAPPNRTNERSKLVLACPRIACSFWWKRPTFPIDKARTHRVERVRMHSLGALQSTAEPRPSMAAASFSSRVSFCPFLSLCHKHAPRALPAYTRRRVQPQPRGCSRMCARFMGGGRNQWIQLRGALSATPSEFAGVRGFCVRACAREHRSRPCV